MRSGSSQDNNHPANKAPPQIALFLPNESASTPASVVNLAQSKQSDGSLDYHPNTPVNHSQSAEQKLPISGEEAILYPSKETTHKQAFFEKKDKGSENRSAAIMQLLMLAELSQPAPIVDLKHAKETDHHEEHKHPASEEETTGFTSSNSIKLNNKYKLSYHPTDKNANEVIIIPIKDLQLLLEEIRTAPFYSDIQKRIFISAIHSLLPPVCFFWKKNIELPQTKLDLLKENLKRQLFSKRR